MPSTFIKLWSNYVVPRSNSFHSFGQLWYLVRQSYGHPPETCWHFLLLLIRNWPFVTSFHYSVSLATSKEDCWRISWNYYSTMLPWSSTEYHWSEIKIAENYQQTPMVNQPIEIITIIGVLYECLGWVDLFNSPTVSKFPVAPNPISCFKQPRVSPNS